MDNLEPELPDCRADERASAHGRSGDRAYLLTFQGGQAIGAAVWGALSDRVGDPITLTLAAVGTSAGLLAALRWVVVDHK